MTGAQPARTRTFYAHLGLITLSPVRGSVKLILRDTPGSVEKTFHRPPVRGNIVPEQAKNQLDIEKEESGRCLDAL